MGVTIIKTDDSETDFIYGTLTNVEADAGGFLRLEDQFSNKDLYLPEVSGTGTVAVASKVFTAVDCTGLTKDKAYLQIELKCTDWSKKSGDTQIEITSSGESDIEEWTYSPASLSITSNYQIFLIPLSSFVTSGGELVVNQIDFIRWYCYFSTSQTISWRNARIINKYYSTGNRISPLFMAAPVGTVKSSQVNFIDRAGLHFNGRDAYASATIPSMTKGAIRCYARVDGPMVGFSNAALVDIGDWPAATGWGVWINIDDGNKIGLRDSKVTYTYSTTALSSTFSKIYAIYNGTDIKLYVNDSLVLTLSSPTVNAASTLTIGKRISADGTTDTFFNGSIDEIELLNESGSQVAFYKLDDGSGTTLNDIVGTYDGTIYNANWLKSVIETCISTDNGLNYSSWSTCADGGSISGLYDGMSAANLIVKCRQTLTADEPVASPIVDLLTLRINARPHTKSVSVDSSSSKAMSGSLYSSKSVAIESQKAAAKLSLSLTKQVTADVAHGRSIASMLKSITSASIDSLISNRLIGAEISTTAQVLINSLIDARGINALIKSPAINSINSIPSNYEITLEHLLQLFMPVLYEKIISGAWSKVPSPMPAPWTKEVTPITPWTESPDISTEWAK